MKIYIILYVFIINLSINNYAQNICSVIGQDSVALLANGYITGNEPCGQNIHTENKWVKVTGADSLHVYTFQHRLFDKSRIYNKNNQLIWEWGGENGNTTWYSRNHSIYIGGNDSIKIEFYQGYADPFCNGYMQITKMICSNTPYLNVTNVGINVAYPQRNLHVKDIIRLEPRTVAPDNPAEGDLYYDGVLHKQRFFDGTNWLGNISHYVGELYQGGIIVSVWKDSGVEHGLIASLIDLSSSQVWSNVSNILIGPTAHSPIDGKANTLAIINQPGHTTSAALLCKNFTFGGYSDWYLPAAWELKECFQVAFVVNSVLGNSNGFLHASYYWSSTENEYNGSWSQGFFDGNVSGANLKIQAYRVRAIRKY